MRMQHAGFGFRFSGPSFRGSGFGVRGSGFGVRVPHLPAELVRGERVFSPARKGEGSHKQAHTRDREVGGDACLAVCTVSKHCTRVLVALHECWWHIYRSSCSIAYIAVRAALHECWWHACWVQQYCDAVHAGTKTRNGKQIRTALSKRMCPLLSKRTANTDSIEQSKDERREEHGANERRERRERKETEKGLPKP